MNGSPKVPFSKEFHGVGTDPPTGPLGRKGPFKKAHLYISRYKPRVADREMDGCVTGKAGRQDAPSIRGRLQRIFNHVDKYSPKNHRIGNHLAIPGIERNAYGSRPGGFVLGVKPDTLLQGRKG